MAAMVRAQALRGYPELVLDLGGKPKLLLRNVGIDPASLDQLTAFVSFDATVGLLERSAHNLDCPDFGLRLAERQDIGMLGTLAVAMRNSPTVRDAMTCASQNLHAHNPAVAFAVSEGRRRSETRLHLKPVVPIGPEWAQTAEHGLGLGWRVLRLLSDGKCQLLGVDFPHDPVAPIDVYEARFDAPLNFGSDHLGVTIRSADLNLPISGYHDDLRAAALHYLDTSSLPAEAPLVAQVHHVIEKLLGTGACSYRDVASALSMNPRTLQRRLREEGTTFEEIKDEVRRDLARRYLAQPAVPLTQVSALLDYSEQSALGRSCRRWFHTTPKALRSRLSPGSPAQSIA